MKRKSRLNKLIDCLDKVIVDLYCTVNVYIYSTKCSSHALGVISDEHIYTGLTSCIVGQLDSFYDKLPAETIVWYFLYHVLYLTGRMYSTMYLLYCTHG